MRLRIAIKSIGQKASRIRYAPIELPELCDPSERSHPSHLCDPSQPPADEITVPLAELIEALVRHEVARYLALPVATVGAVGQVDSLTDEGAGEPMTPMGEDYLAVLWHTGKIGFGTRRQQVFGTDCDSQEAKDKLTQEAIDTALLAFTDGLYAVFVDDAEISQLDTPVTLRPESTLVLLRLTFLAGSIW